MSKRTYAKRYGTRIAERDGWNCHYCSVPLVPTNVEYGDLRFFYPRNIYVPGRGRRAYQVRIGYEMATVDHVIPRRKGGSDDLDNLVLACLKCNGRKRIADAADFKEATQ